MFCTWAATPQFKPRSAILGLEDRHDVLVDDDRQPQAGEVDVELGRFLQPHDVGAPRGYFVESLSRTHVRAACAYVARQHARHPDRVPA